MSKMLMYFNFLPQRSHRNTCGVGQSTPFARVAEVETLRSHGPPFSGMSPAMTKIFIQKINIIF